MKLVLLLGALVAVDAANQLLGWRMRDASGKPLPEAAGLSIWQMDCVEYICSQYTGEMIRQCTQYCRASANCDHFSQWCWQTFRPFRDVNSCVAGRSQRCECLIKEASTDATTCCSTEGPVHIPPPIRQTQTIQMQPPQLPTSNQYGSPSMDSPVRTQLPFQAALTNFANDCASFICSKHDGLMKQQCLQKCQISKSCDDFSKWCWQNVAPLTDTNSCFKGRNARCQCLIAEKSNTKETSCTAPLPGQDGTLIPAILPAPTPLNTFTKDCADFICSKHDGIMKQQCLQTCQASTSCPDFSKWCWQNVAPWTDTNSCFKGRNARCLCLIAEKSNTKQTACIAQASMPRPVPSSDIPRPQPYPAQIPPMTQPIRQQNYGQVPPPAAQPLPSPVAVPPMGQY